MRERVVSIILESAEELSQQFDYPIDLARGEQAPLFGPGGAFDSLGLASLVIAIEQALQDEFGTSVTLASEQAMSRSSSVFRTVGTLADFACEQLQKETERG